MHEAAAAGGFLPHGFCYLWNRALLLTHLTSDLLIGLSYVAISASLVYLVYRARRDIPFSPLFLAFGLFIVACGATHFMEVWTLWHASYWLAGGLKVVTAAASVTTAIAMPFMVPRVLDTVRDARIGADERERRFRRVVDTDIMGILFWDAAGEIADANDAFLRIVGYTREDLEAKRVQWRQMTPPEWIHLDERALVEIAARGSCTPFEKEYVRKDGSRVRILLGASSLDAERRSGVAFVTDVSDRWAVEEALRTSEARYRLLFDGSPLPMWVFDRDSLRFLAVNNAAIEQYGFTRDEFLAMTIRDIRPPEDVPLLESMIRSSPRPVSRAAAVRHRRKDGTVFDVEVTADWLDFAGRPARLVLANDVTELRRAHAALAATNEELAAAVKVAEDANKAKSEFLAVMSHELRTPLNAIVGYSELMALEIAGPVSEDQQDKLTRVSQAANHLLSLINQVLDFERSAAGRDTVFHEEVDVGDLLRETIADVEPQAVAKGLAVTIEPPRERLVVVTDAAKLRQIVTNLLSNAVKYTDRGRVSAGARRVDGFIEVRVHDTGLGIKPEHQERIFEAFWQADQQLTRQRGGTGLGLSIVRQLVRLLGGDVTVDSVPDQGSVFTLRLPVTPVREPVAA